jgi:prepilin-type N-terminal cleavage/methylation domain-containing protein
MQHARHRSGFTLVELSIVLVIIGLIVGAIMAGRELIEQAAIRSTISDLAKYKSAVNAFRTKYNCLPGDCSNAQTYFGSAGSMCNNIAYSGNWNGNPPATGTCNGDGDGMILPSQTSYEPPGWEDSTFWDHLAKANLVSGEQSVRLPNGGTYVGGSLTSALHAAFLISEVDNNFGSAHIIAWPLMLNHNVFWLAASQPNGNNPPYQNAVTPAVAQQIDRKIDDGLPGSGTVFSEYAGGANMMVSGTAGCVTPVGTYGNFPPSASSTYDLTTTTIACVMAFYAGF